MEDSLKVSYKFNIYLSDDQAIAHLGIYSKKMKNTLTKKDKHMNIYSNFIHNILKLEKPRCLPAGK